MLLAVVIAFALMMGWSYIFPPEEPPENLDEVSESGTPTVPDRPEAAKPEAAGPEPVAGQAPGSAPAIADAPPRERGPEQLFELEHEQFRAVFTNYGAALQSWELQGKKFEQERDGKTWQVDLVRTEQPLLSFDIGFEEMELVPEGAEWKAERRSDTEIAFTWSYVAQQDGQEVVLYDIVKTYRLHPADYLVELTVDVYNRAAQTQKLPLTVGLYGYQDPAEDTGGGLGQIDLSWQSACYINGELYTGGLEEDLPIQRSGDLRWVGFTQSYFLVAASPVVEPGTTMECSAIKVSGVPGAMRTRMEFPAVNLAPGDPPMTRTVVAYLGPKNVEKLEAVAGVVGHEPMFTEAVDMGWFGFLARPLLSLLQWFYSFVGNWGVSIIFLTIVVKLATLYWTTKSMRSMKKMARLKPKIEAIQKKYKDDKQRQQVEVMNLYKAHQVNPLAGCLPMVLQMPIWFALYRMLMAAAELYHAPFIPGWIDDLTATDPYYILPIVLVGMMFLQAKLAPNAGDSTQQKVMMYGLPLTFGVFSFFFPSGLTLYILTNTVLTTLHQFWMNRTEPTGTPVPANGGAGTDATSKAAEADEDAGEAQQTRGAGKDAGASAQKKSSPGSKTARKRGGQKKISGKSRKRGGAA